MRCGRALVRAVVMVLLLPLVLSIAGLCDLSSPGKIAGFNGHYVTHRDLPGLIEGKAWAGEIVLSVQGASRVMYCYDMYTAPLSSASYHPAGYVTLPQIVYLLHHYHPLTGQPSGLSSSKDRAAAVQLALWHYRHGVDLGTFGSPAKFFQAARSIIAEVDSSGGTADCTLSLEPDQQSRTPGSSVQMRATLLCRGLPLAGKLVTFTVAGANNLSGSAATDGQGVASFVYSGSGVGRDAVFAVAEAAMPGAVLWKGAGSQDLIEAALVPLSAEAEVDWEPACLIQGPESICQGQVATYSILPGPGPGSGSARGWSVDGQSLAAGEDLQVDSDHLSPGEHLIALELKNETNGETIAYCQKTVRIIPRPPASIDLS